MIQAALSPGVLTATCSPEAWAPPILRAFCKWEDATQPVPPSCATVPSPLIPPALHRFQALEGIVCFFSVNLLSWNSPPTHPPTPVCIGCHPPSGQVPLSQSGARGPPPHATEDGVHLLWAPGSREFADISARDLRQGRTSSAPLKGPQSQRSLSKQHRLQPNTKKPPPSTKTAGVRVCSRPLPRDPPGPGGRGFDSSSPCHL